jgi:hypothetical protein
MALVGSALAAAVGLAGCGTGARMPNLSGLPLLPGSTIVTQIKECNKGDSAFCAIELVVQDHRYPSSRALVLSQRDRLKALGWTGASPDTGVQLADESPGHKLRVTYATAVDDLQGIDLGWIARPRSIEMLLDRAVFNNVPTMSVLLEVGSK